MNCTSVFKPESRFRLAVSEGRRPEAEPVANAALATEPSGCALRPPRQRSALTRMKRALGFRPILAVLCVLCASAVRGFRS